MTEILGRNEKERNRTRQKHCSDRYTLIKKIKHRQYQRNWRERNSKNIQASQKK